MGTIPPIPEFPAGMVVTSGAGQGTLAWQGSAASLSELATAITWCLSGKPLCQCQQLSSQSISTGTNTVLAWDTNLRNRDSMWSSGNNNHLVAATPGIYLVSANVNFQANSTGARAIWFEVTTGTNNPQGSGNSSSFGYAAANAAAGGITSAVASQMLSPYLYDGDYLTVYAYQNSGSTLSTEPTSADQGPMMVTAILVSG